MMIKFFKNLFVVLLVWLIGGWPAIAFALPQDGQVVGGDESGVISHPTDPNGPDMQIDQHQQQMVINWQSFNIGSNEWVNFSQPNSNAIALNRVIGSDPSLLLGKLTGNGQVFISNGSGVYFGPNSQVDTHGLIATTMGISDQDFIDGNYNFTQDPSNLSSVINEGNISATSYVGLLAPAVENRGEIVTASLGSIDLASGTAATMDFTGDGLIQFEVTQAVSGTVLDKDGNELKDRVSNTGLLHADGGQIRMSAKDAGDVIRHVVNMEGMIKANTVVEKGGKVFLMGGDSGVVNVSGTIETKGDDAGEKGGDVVILGEKVGLFDQAKVDASGDGGGGEILIGGEQQGATAIEGQMNADFVYMDDDVEINANAISNGDGGRIITWATDTNRAYANIYARGGASSGNGGFVEISGGKYFEIGQVPDVTAANGSAGHWLIDPVGNDLSIVAGGGNTNINSANPFATTNDSASVGWNLILAALTAGTTVTVTTTTSGTNSENGDINVNTDLDYNGIGTGKTLTLTAIGDINFNNKIFDSSGTDDILNLNLNSGGAIAFNASGNVVSGNLVASTLDGVGGTFTIGGSADLSVTGTGSSSITAFDFVFDSTLNFSGTGTFSLNQSSTSSHFGIGTTTCQTTSCDTDIDNAELNRITVANGTLEFNGSSKIFVKDVAAANTDQINQVTLTQSTGQIEFETGTGNTFTNLTVNAGNGIAVNDDVTTTGNMAMDGDSNNSSDGTDSIVVTGSTLSSSGTMTLDATTGGITTSGTASFSATSGITVNDTLSITTGTVTFSSTTSISNLNLSGGTLTANGAVSVTSGFDWQTGASTISGSGTFTTGNFAQTMSDNGTKTLDGVTWNNQGTMVMSGGFGSAFAVNNGATFNNTNSFEISSASDITSSGGGTFDNSGTFTYSSTANKSVATTFNNTGTVVLSNTGTLTFTVAAGATDNGTYNVSNASGKIVFNNTRTFGSSADFQGTGTVEWAGANTIDTSNLASTLLIEIGGSGTTTFNNTNTVASLTLSGGDLIVSSGVTLTASTGFTWTAASNVSGLGTLITDTGVSGSILDNSATKVLSGSSMVWTNRGDITFSGGTGFHFTLDSGATLNNEGTFTITNSAGSDILSTGGTNTINNTGTFTHNSTSTNDVNPEFNNLAGGTVSATNTGTLNIANGNTTATSDIGDYSVTNASGGINFNGGSRTFTSTVGFTGSGNFTFSAGGTTTFTNVTMNNTGTVTLSGTTLTTGNTNLSITAGDLAISSALNVGTGDLTIIAASGGDIGLGDTTTGCAGSTCEMTISGAELQLITATNLILGDTTTTSITVDNVSAANSNNIGTVTLNAKSAAGVVTFDTLASTFNALEVSAGNGITMAVNLTTDTGNMTLDGDSDNATGGTIAFTAGVTLMSTGSMTLDATNGGLTTAGAVTFNAYNGVTINDSFVSTGAGTVSVDADFDNNGVGDFNLASGAAINFSTFNNALAVIANDVDIQGTINTGTAQLSFTPSDGGTLGIGAATCGGTCGMTISGTEFQQFTVQDIQFITAASTAMFIDSLTATNTAGSTGLVQFNSGGALTVSGTTMTFNTAGTGVNGINLNAQSGDLNLNTGVTVTAGALTLRASNNVLVAAGLTFTAGDAIDLQKFGAGSDILAAGSATFNAGNGINVDHNFTSQSTGALVFNADSDNNGSGDFNITAGETLNTNNNNVSITAADFNLNTTGIINAGTGDVALLVSNGGSINVGATVGAMQIDNTELNLITAANLNIGDSSTGAITINGLSVLATITNLTLTSGSTVDSVTLVSTLTNNLAVVAGGNISQSAGLLVGGTSSFTVSGSSTITLTNTGNSFTGAITLVSAGGAVDLTNSIASTITSATTSGGNLSLAALDFTITSINAGAGDVSITGFGGLTIGLGATAGAIHITGAELQNITAANLTIGDANDGTITVDGITAAHSGNISGTITLNAPLSGSAVNFSNTASVFNGGLTVNAGNGINVNVDVTTNGTTTFDADADGNGTGSLDVADSQTVNTSGNNLSISGGDFNLNTSGKLNAGAGDVTLLASSGRTIGVGAGGLNFDIEDAELGNITANNLTIGNNISSHITVDGVTAANTANISGTITLDATASATTITFSGSASIFSTGLTANAEVGININTSLTTNGATAFNSDSNDNGTGTFTIASSSSLNTNNNNLSITAGGFAMSGTDFIIGGSGTVTIVASNGGNIGLGDTTTSCSGGTCNMSITGAELENITAATLVLGDTTTTNITVDNITAANSNNIGTVTLNATSATGVVTFDTAASTFNAVTANAGNGIAMLVDLTTDTGNLVLEGDSDNATSGGIAITAGVTLTSAGTMTLDATTSGINPAGNATFVATSGVTVNDTLTITTGTTTFSSITSINDLSMTGGTLTANAAVSVTSGLTLTAGTINGSGSFTTTSGVTAGSIAASAGAVNLDTLTWTNAGTVTFSGSGGNDFIFGSGAIFNNSGTFNMSAAVTNSVLDGTGIFNNSGTFEAGGVTVNRITVNLVFNNTGQVNLSTGSLEISSTGADTGDYDISSGRQLTFDGSRTYASTTDFTSSGSLTFSGGTHEVNTSSVASTLLVTLHSGPTVNFNAGVALGTVSTTNGTINFNTGTVSINDLTMTITSAINFDVDATLGSLTVTGGTLDLNGAAVDLTVTSGFSWTGGTISGTSGSTFTTTAGVTAGTIDTSSAAVVLDTVAWDNFGTVSFDGSGAPDFAIDNNAVFTNKAGANFNLINTGTGALITTLSGTGTFTNEGTVTKTAGATTTFSTTNFNNTGGTVSSTTGTINISSNGTDTGTYDVASGTTINFDSGTRDFNATTFTGLGTFSLSAGGTFNINSDTTIPNLTFSGGTINLNGATVDLTVTSGFTWTNGNFTGTAGSTFTTTSGVTAGTITNTGLVSLTDVIWNNQGTVTWDGSNDLSLIGTTLNNSGTFEMAVTAATNILDTSSSSINNSGTVTHNSTSNTLVVPGFNNSGTVNVSNTGNFTLFSAATADDTGSYSITSTGILVLGGNRTFDGTKISGTGTVNFSAGTFTTNSSLTLEDVDVILAQDITGTGTVNLEVTSANTIGLGVSTCGGSCTTTYAAGNLGRFKTTNLVIGGAGSSFIETVAIGDFDASVTDISFLTTAGNITFNTDSMAFFNDTTKLSTISAALGTVTVPGTAAGTIGLGNANCGGSCGFTITGAKLATITASSLVVGDALSSNIFVDGVTAANMANITNLTLNATISTGTIAFSGGDSFFQGLTLNADDGVTLSSNVTTTGVVTADADADNDGTGTFTVDDTFTLNTGNNALGIVASDLNLNTTGALNSGTGFTSIAISNSGTIGLGNSNCGGTCGMQISGSELGRITTGILTIGDSASGNMTVDGVTTSTAMVIESGGTVIFDTGASAFNGALTAVAGGAITQTAALTVVGGANFASTGGDITLADATNDLGTSLTISAAQSFNVDPGATTSLTDLSVTVDPAGACGTCTYVLDISNIGNVSAFTLSDTGANVSVGAMTATALNLSLTTGSGQVITSGAINVGTGSFSLTTNGNIDAAMIISNTITAGSLVLDANGQQSDVAVNADINITDGSVSITADDSVTFAAGVDLVASGAGNVTVESNTDTLDGASQDDLVMDDDSGIDAGSGTITLTSTGTGAGNITVAELKTTSSSSSAISVNSISTVFDAGDTRTSNFNAVNGGVVLVAGSSIGNSGATSLEFDVASLDATNSANSLFANLQSDVSITQLNIFNQANFIGTGSITQTGAITAVALTANTNGAITLTNTSNNVSSVSFSTTGNIDYVDADAFTVNTTNSVVGVSSGSGANINLTATTGQVTITSAVTATAGDISITADKMDIVAAVSASGQRVKLKSSTADDAVDLGSGLDSALNTLELSDTELDLITANYLEIGSTTQGAITLSGDISPANIMVLHLISNSTVTGTAGGIVVAQLAIEAGGKVDISDTTTDVDLLAINATGQDVTFYDTDDLDINTVDTVVGVKAASFTTPGPGPLTATEAILLDSAEEELVSTPGAPGGPPADPTPFAPPDLPGC